MKEDELIHRERALNTQIEEKSAELNERENLLNEILRLYELPLITGDLKKALQVAVEQTSQGSTCGSYFHTLRDSKQFYSDSFSPLKSGGCDDNKGASGGSADLRTSQAILNSLNSKGGKANNGHGAAANNNQQMRLQLPASPSQTQNVSKTVNGVAGGKQKILKNNKSDPNMRTFLSMASNYKQHATLKPCQTSIKKSFKADQSQLECEANNSNFATYAVNQTVQLRSKAADRSHLPLQKQNPAVVESVSPMAILKRFKM